MDKPNAIPTSPSAGNRQSERILVINPGSTPAKIAVYKDEVPLLVRNIRHIVGELPASPQMIDQFEFRKSLVLRELEADDTPFQFDAVIGRGGLVKPIPGRAYEINKAMKRDTLHAMRTHACSLDGLIADKLAAALPGCWALIVDPGVVDKLEEVVRITSSPLMPRITTRYALDQKAIAHRYAAEHGTRYENLDLTVCHLGGGISAAVRRHGCAVDTNSILDEEGPSLPERTGTPPAGQLINLCFSRKFTKDELEKRISDRAGLAAHLGTTDIPAVIQSVEADDNHARLVLDATTYNVAKSIGATPTVLYGEIDIILLTGGIAYSGYVISRLRERISFLVPVFAYPGEDEMEALALNALGALGGGLPVQVYQ